MVYEENMTIDLNQLVEKFIRTRLDDPLEIALDRNAIQAIDGRGSFYPEREERLLRWLHHYKVLMFFPPENSQRIAAQILDYADSQRQLATLPLTQALIVSEYEKLKARILEAAPPTKSGKQRGVSSLASKALWCCYPNDIPIFDNYARRALQIVSRLYGLRLTESNMKGACEYAEYVDLWFQVYTILKPVLETVDLEGCPKVRVFDRFLWYIGQPNFEASGISLHSRNNP